MRKEDRCYSVRPAVTKLIPDMIESILLLIWRHLLFYANDARGAQEHVRPGDLAASLGAFSSSQVDASRSKAGTVRVLERIAGGLRGSLERLDDVDTVSISHWLIPSIQIYNDGTKRVRRIMGC
jgi:hypothetical protein